MPAMAVASRKESYHARSRRPPRGEETTIDYFYTEVSEVSERLPSNKRIFDTEYSITLLHT